MPYRFLTDQTARRLTMLNEVCKRYNDAPEQMPLQLREELSMMFGATFKNFQEFAELGMKYLGFNLSLVQADIAMFMQHGHKLRMVQAQRGEAKSTLAALYVIWRLIQNPSDRILIVSAGGKQADSIALLIYRFISQWHLLCWLRPDVSKGDKDSAKAFDVHFALKGIDKSASVSSVGITANLQGMRADFILADDIETQRNSLTQGEREKLLMYTKEFAAICIKGEIMYLGTPQTKDSVYRSLPARGYAVKVWCGRYPTNEELERYGAGVSVAEYIMNALLANPALQSGGGITGERGQPTDPEHIDEGTLQDKELEYGDEGFALQYMLDTTLSDAMRTKIKLTDMPVIGVSGNDVPERINYSIEPSRTLVHKHGGIANITLYQANTVGDKYVPFEYKVATLDPAGCGGDEMSFAIGGATNSYIYLLSTGGFLGGATEDNINRVIFKMLDMDVHVLDIERNMGHGTVTQLFISQIEKLKNYCTAAIKEQLITDWCIKLGIKEYNLLDKLRLFSVSDYFVTTQKERRIIDTISPVTRRNKLILTRQAIEDDWNYCMQYSSEKRASYSGLQQLANITYDRNSLIHDDRADCIQRMVAVLSPYLSKDDEKAQQERNEAEVQEWLDNPMGLPSYALEQLGRNRSKSNRLTNGGRRYGR